MATGDADDRDGGQEPATPSGPASGGRPAGGNEEDAGVSVPVPPSYAIHVSPTDQIKGDVKKGYDYLVNGDYQTLGLPWAGFSATMTELQPRDSLPGRTGDNAKVSYMFNVVTDPDGIKVAASNCLTCHSSHLNGKLIVGLGRANYGEVSSGVSTDPKAILRLSTLREKAVAIKFATRAANAAQYGQMDVFPVLASHHDPRTLEWTEEPVFNGDTQLVGAVDIPPWWRTKKKGGLYYTGVGRGQQSRHMSFMSVFSVRDTKEGEKIEENFVNVGEYIRSIEPPAFPETIDQPLAAEGAQVFLDTCAMCHGTYGENWTYPNVIIPYEQVGTDPSLATDNWVNQATIDWFASSFYADNGKSWMEQSPGYYAPPLDGIWATAPFFHNGSVPTLDGVIDPDKRPAVWHTEYGDDGYDLEHVGWKLAPVENGESASGAFDSSAPGNSNQGHVYGAGLSDKDQEALLEYLKTL